MAENNPRLSAFEARLAQLRKNMEAGLGERAARIEAHMRALSTAPYESRQGLRHEAHKLRGVAGTFGHASLGELAGTLEQVALDGPADAIASLAQGLVDAVRKAGIAVPNVAAPEPDGSAVAPVVKAASVPRVLAIDDDDETRKLLELTLRQLGGFDTVVAINGTSALERLAQERFDLVLCDAMMPDMNGLQFCARAKSQATEHAPPIVILSAATPEELGWSLATEHAPHAWWRKPFRPKQLIEDVKGVLLARPSSP